MISLAVNPPFLRSVSEGGFLGSPLEPIDLSFFDSSAMTGHINLAIFFSSAKLILLFDPHSETDWHETKNMSVSAVTMGNGDFGGRMPQLYHIT